MPGKTPGRPRKKSPKAGPRGATPRRDAQTGVDRYIAGQLKTIYDEVVAEPIPDRLVELLNRLDRDGKG